MGRKFEKFTLEIEMLNGETKEMKSGAYDSKNYKQMMRFYKLLVKQYQNEDCKIKFKGIAKDGSTSCFFIKEIKTEDSEEQREIIKYDNNSVESIIEDIKKNYDMLLKKKEIADNRLMIVNKKIDVVLHNLEADFYKDKDERKRAFESIVLLRKQRRLFKNDSNIINDLNNKKLLNMIDVDKVNGALELVKKVEKTRFNKSVQAGAAGYKYSTKEYKYKNHKERISLVKQLGTKYDRVVLDEAKMTIVCYNNVYKKNF